MINKNYKSNNSIAILVPNDIPNNSIFLQAKLLKTTFEEIIGNQKIPIISTQSKNNPSMRKNVYKYSNIIYHYGSYDPIVNLIYKHKNAIFIYHNVTPAKYFWKWEPKVSIRSILSTIQLKSLPKDINWIAVSTYNAKCLKNLGFRNVAVCPVQITPNLLINKNIIRNENQLVYVGRISPNKNCLELLDQVYILLSHITKPIILEIVGNYKENSNYLSQFKKQVERLHKNPKISINWHQNIISKNQLDKIYLNSTLFISMSLHEGFGLPICEAIALGCPGIYLECGGTESVLSDIGMVSRKEDKKFHIFIEQMMRSQLERNELLKKQQKIVANYMIPNIHTKITQTYLPLLDLS